MSAPSPVPLHGAHAELTVLDYLCLLWPDRARRTIHDLFASGIVRSDGRPVSPKRTVSELGDLSIHTSLESIPTMFASSAEVQSPVDLADVGVSTLYEDDRLVVLRKPSGVPVVPDRSRRETSCLEVLTRRELAGRKSKSPDDFLRYRIVHRIDRLTSGLVIVAKTSDAERQLCAAFESRSVQKEYLAIVRGRVPGSRIVVPSPIAPGRKGKVRCVSPGTSGSKQALTVFEVLERFDSATLVRARPHTGRQHQIRVHAWAMGHPLAIDPVYAVGERAKGGAIRGIERLTLHACRYTLPSTWAEPRSFECPLDDDFVAAIAQLRGPHSGKLTHGGDVRSPEKINDVRDAPGRRES